MKKHLILGLAALSMLAACSSDENVDAPSQQSRAIGFNPFLGKVTKSQQNTGNFKQFRVWGWMTNGTSQQRFMNDLLVTKDGTGNWTYTPKQYWENGYSYRFIGLYPLSQINAGASEDGRYPGLPTNFEENNYGSVGYDVGIGESDFVAAIAEVSKVNTSSCPAPVDMTFHHLLSRINFAFTNGMEDKSSLVISNVTITGLPKYGRVFLTKDLHDVTWQIIGTTTTNAVVPGSALLPGDGGRLEQGQTGYTTEKFIIPWMPVNEQEVKKYTITFQIDRYIGSGDNSIKITYTKSVDLPIPAEGWLPGHSYLFTAELNHTNILDNGGEMCEIMFNVTVDEWTDPTQSTVIPGFDPTTPTPVTPSEENQ